ncbi:MAG: protealysin inhibitor emfourin [Cyanobacteria bacterium J06633_8]
MLISLERSGGFAGISKIIEIDTAKLRQEQAQHVEILIDSANFFDLPAYIAADSKQRDRFQYALTVKDDSRQHTVTVAESAIPNDLKPLIQWINCNGE